MAFWETSPVFISNKRKKEQLDKQEGMTETIQEYDSTTIRLHAQIEELEKKLNEKGKLHFLLLMSHPLYNQPGRYAKTLQ